MKKLLILLSVLGLLVSCGTKGTVTNNGQDLPQWVIDPSFDGKIAGIGIAGKSHGGFAVQRSIAITKAKGDLAARIESKVSQISKAALQQAKTNNLGDDFISNFEEGTTVIVKGLSLSGITPVNIKKIDGELYVRVALDGKDYSKLVNNVQKSIERKVQKSQKSQNIIKKSLEATKKLFDELKN